MKPTGLFWWIDRWRKSTAYTDLTLEEQGAYRNLLDEAHLRGGPIPNDERILAKSCGDAIAWSRVREHVLARFVLHEDGWRNETMDEVYARTMELKQGRAEAGRMGGLRSGAARRAKSLANEANEANHEANHEAKSQANTQATPPSKTPSKTNSPSPSPSPSPDPSPSPSVDSKIREQICRGSDSSKSGANGHSLAMTPSSSHRVVAKAIARKITTDEKVRRHAPRIR